MNPDEAAYVHERLENVPADLAQSYKELVDEGENVEGISENFADHIPQERMTRLAESAFFCFAIDVLDPPAPVMPQMVNTQDNPEVQALVQTHLMDHYRRTLDEPIPMLDNHTPRACAADPGKRQSVIDWLKYLENRTSKTSGSSTDLRWLWTELGLDAYQPKSTTE